jgi:drug/metabolite transporter (DMT)-like permease
MAERALRDRLSTPSPHTRAVVEALFVTLLWASSYVLVKIGLEDIPALTFAGLRYTLGAAVLVLVVGARRSHRDIFDLDCRDWVVLVGLGITLYAVTQGAQFVALNYLRAATLSLVLNGTPVLVAAIAAVTLDERPHRRQLFGMAVLLFGVVVYFHPLDLPYGRMIGLAVMAVGLVGNAIGSVLGRASNRTRTLSPLIVTTVSMSVGGLVLLGSGVTVQGMPPLSIANWAIVVWLAVVNTALAFTLWNRTLQRLTAVESSVINNTLLVQIAVLGWLFLGESLGALDIVGLALVSVGALIVQVVGRW